MEGREARRRPRRSAPGGPPAAPRHFAPARLSEDRVALALWIMLAALAALRAASSLSSGMWLWGLNAQRFLPWGMGWLAWLALALVLAPAVGRALAPAAAKLGDALVHRPVPAGVIAALASAALVWALPDRTLFLGDFAMRSGTILTGSDAARLFPQAMPFDLQVHVRLPKFLIAHAGWTVQDALRSLGALGAALLAVAAVRLPRALGLSGAAALAAAAIVWGGGTLGMFTGYGKSAIEMTALTALAGAAALGAVREGRGLVTLGLATALALGFHRSGVLLMPLALAAFATAPGSWRRPARWIGAAMVAASLAVFGPRALHLITTFDVLHHLAPPETRASGGMFASLLDPLHLLDVLNVTLVLSPLAPTLFALAFTKPRAGENRGAMAGGPASKGAAPASPSAKGAMSKGDVSRGGAPPSASRLGHRMVLAALALPALAMLLLTRPQQGVFRDRDVFAPAAIALSVLAACGVGGALRASPGRAWLAAALVLGTVLPSVQWLVLMHRPDDALRYVREYIQGPPERLAWDRAATWDFLGTRALVLHRGDAAAQAYANAVQAAQNPRLIGEWGMADLMRGDYPRAESLFKRAVALNPNSTVGWNGLAAAASWLGDTAACVRAESSLSRMDPQNPRLIELRAYLARARSGR